VEKRIPGVPRDGREVHGGRCKNKRRNLVTAEEEPQSRLVLVIVVPESEVKDEKLVIDHLW
jgi:hypothetical protein